MDMLVLEPLFVIPRHPLFKVPKCPSFFQVPPIVMDVGQFSEHAEGHPRKTPPQGFSDTFDVKWLRESELKHGRVLAAIVSLQIYNHGWSIESPRETNGSGSKIGTQNGTLANGNMD